MKKKVLILINHDVWLYKLRYEIVEALLNEGCEVWISCPYGDKIEIFKDMGCHYVESKFDRHGVNPISELKLFMYFNRIIGEIRPDIVLTYTIKPNTYGGIACRLRKVPYIVNITGLGTAVENGGLMQAITLTLYRSALKKARKVFFQNESNRDFMLKRRAVTTQPYDILPGSGVNLDKYTVTPYPNGDTVDFMFISRIMKDKGIDQYLDAAKVIRKKYPNTRFHICGFCEREYEGELKRCCDDGTVIYHGLVDDIAKMHSISSCTIHPSYYPEGMSNVLLESCACGRPIITTDRSGCREVVEDGVNGFIVRAKDSDDLIKKIEAFLSLSYEKRRDMGLAGRAKVEREFDRKTVADKYLREVRAVEP